MMIMSSLRLFASLLILTGALIVTAAPKNASALSDPHSIEELLLEGYHSYDELQALFESVIE